MRFPLNIQRHQAHHSRIIRRATITAIAGVAALSALAACSPTEEEPSVQETKITNTTPAPKSTAAASPKPGESKVTIDANPTEDLKAGDDITIELSGLDPAHGYYAAICSPVKVPGNPVPICSGGQGDATAQAWIKTGGGTAPINEDGTATTTIVATPTGTDINCLEQDCVLKIFGDHSEGFVDVVDLPVTFAK